MAQICQRVVIINRGRVVAVDTPDNLSHQLKGAATLDVQIDSQADAVPALSALPGVRQVNAVDRHEQFVGYEVTNPSTDIRRDVARTVVDQVAKPRAPADANEPRRDLPPAHDQRGATRRGARRGRRQRGMSRTFRNIAAVASKELRGYFVSPVAWVMLGLFASSSAGSSWSI